jgi:hypothetical protein
LLETIYEEDIEEFEDPAKTEHTVKSFTDPSFDCPLWLRELHKVAPQVKPRSRKARARSASGLQLRMWRMRRMSHALTGPAAMILTVLRAKENRERQGTM